jgi:hypothetical protein
MRDVNRAWQELQGYRQDSLARHEDPEGKTPARVLVRRPGEPRADPQGTKQRETRHVYGGDERIRTADPHVANVVLSQLSYIPIWVLSIAQGTKKNKALVPRSTSGILARSMNDLA